MEILALYLASFLLGSIPFGVLMARAFHVKDLQSRGSGNIGATNVSRVAGFWPAGFLTFLLDFVKGGLPVLVVSLPYFQSWWSMLTHQASEITTGAIWLIGLCAVLGHCFSPWVRFKGGKGVATGLGVIVVLAPLAALIGTVAFAFSFFKTKIGSLSSVIGLVSAALAYLIRIPSSAFGAHLWIGAALIFLILFRHESNLDALLEGRERKF
jgi:glycerol-3-phosphate acyltransferase PlsY